MSLLQNTLLRMSCDEADQKKNVSPVFSSCSLQENRPLSKAFFTRMIEIEKEQVRTAPPPVCRL